MRGLLDQYDDQVRHALEMATIETSTCRTSSSTWRRRKIGRYDRQRVLDLLRDLEFRTLVPRLPPVDEGYSAPAGASAGGESPPRTPAQIEKSYTLVNDESALDDLVERIREAGRFAFDLEGAGTSPYHCLLVGVAIAAAPGEAYYIPVGHQSQRVLSLDDAGSNRLSSAPTWCSPSSTPLFGDIDIEKVAHNGKFDVAYLASRRSPRPRLRLRHAAGRLHPRRRRPGRWLPRPAPAP